MSKNKVTAIILAAGSGSRMGAKTTKQRMLICGESMLLRTVRAFEKNEKTDNIVVVVREDEVSWAREELSVFSKPLCVIAGGKNRAESAKIGFANIPADSDYVAIHDGARCLIKSKDISSVIDKAIAYGAATAVSPVYNTVKRVDEDGFIAETLPRNMLYSAQTPQVFKKSIYEKALICNEKCENITDDNMMVENIGEKIYPVNIGGYNIKITTAEDISYAEYLIGRERSMYETRVGHGYDVHRLCEGRELIIGGVNIPYEVGLLGHSDADVLLHAIMDAILGASSLGDIGRIFPDTDESYLGISSLKLLRRVNELIKKNGFEVVNIDATVILERPKLAPYIENMVHNISETLMIEPSRINIKATTEEKLGFTGSGEGASAHAVAMLKKVY